MKLELKRALRMFREYFLLTLFGELTMTEIVRPYAVANIANVQSLLGFLRAFVWDFPAKGMKMVNGLKKAKVRLTLRSMPIAVLTCRSAVLFEILAWYFALERAICSLVIDSGSMKNNRDT